LIVMAIYSQATYQQRCVPTPDGCYSDDEGTAVILLPYLFQWGFWFLMFFLGRHVLFAIKRKNAP
jgi:hypothetical protein